MPRVLGRFVRERKALTLADAIHKMTARPADRVHLRDRGRLAVGMAGDVVVFNADTVADTATFANPFPVRHWDHCSGGQRGGCRSRRTASREPWPGVARAVAPPLNTTAART
ncbi:MAG: amidohydrolase family protein [Gemmatimonas sp.]|nr:amidohydrolase family protein [Gemmatimonas sp.]